MLVSVCLLSGCIFPDVYKLDVQQGNIVTQDMLDQLKPGMDQRQVLYVMGTPVLKNPYQEKRWDYLYSLEQDDVVTKRYRVSLYFDDAFKYSHYVGQVPAKPISDEQKALSQQKQDELKETKKELKKVEKEVEEKQQKEAETKLEDQDFSKKDEATD